jgi:hypothetical protein
VNDDTETVEQLKEMLELLNCYPKISPVAVEEITQWIDGGPSPRGRPLRKLL